MADKKTDLLPKDAHGALETLLCMRQRLAREFGEASMRGKNYAPYAPDIVQAYAEALQADLELRRQILIKENAMPSAETKRSQAPLRLNRK